MIGNSAPEYFFIRFSIALLRLVAPISILYIATCIYSRAFLFTPILGSLALIESLFYILVYLPRKRRLQRTSPYKPSPLTSAQRKALFARCSADVGTLVQTETPPYPRGWFLGQKTDPANQNKLHRQDVIDWILCTLFSSSRAEFQEEWKEELDAYVTQVEQLLGEDFSVDTGDSGTKGMRVMFDPVKMTHRPLIWYLVVCLVDTLTCLRLSFRGFQHYSSTQKWFQVFPPRPLLSFISRKAHPAPDILLPYWYRPHKSSTKLPVMFLHGIGIGLYPYLPLLHDIVSLEPDVGILLVELLPISMHMTTHPVPPAPLIASALNDILDHHGISRVILSAHSYSTFITSSILHDSFPAYNVSSPHPGGDTPSAPHPLLSKIAHVVLVDPIPILLHLPPVAYNFLYRTPSRAAEWQLWYFASTDPDVARSLSRSFFWTEGVAWKEDIRRWMHGSPAERHSGREWKKRNVAIVLGGKDQIVPSETIRRYLTDEAEVSSRWVSRGWAYRDQSLSSYNSEAVKVSIRRTPDESDGNATTSDTILDTAEVGVGSKYPEGGDLEVLFNPKLDHATVFDAGAREPLLDVFIRFINDL